MDRWYPDRIIAGSIDDYLPRLSNPAYTTGLIQVLGQLFAGRDRRLLRNSPNSVFGRERPPVSLPGSWTTKASSTCSTTMIRLRN